MATLGVTLWEDGTSSAGIWECAPGPSYWKLATHEAAAHVLLIVRSPPITARWRCRAARSPGESRFCCLPGYPEPHWQYPYGDLDASAQLVDSGSG